MGEELVDHVVGHWDIERAVQRDQPQHKSIAKVSLDDHYGR